MTQQDPNNKSKSDGGKRSDPSGVQQQRGDDVRTNDSSNPQSARDDANKPQAARGDKNDRGTGGNASLPRYDDRPTTREGGQDDGDDGEQSTQGRGDKNSSTPNYGDREAGDPRKTSIEANGGKSGASTKSASAGASQSGSGSMGTTQNPSKSTGGNQGNNPGTQSKGKSDSAGR